MVKSLARVLSLAFLVGLPFVGTLAQAAQPSVLCSGAYHHEIVKGDAPRAGDACVFKCWYDENARECETVVGSCAAPKPKAWAYIGGKYGVMSFWDFRSVPCKAN